MAELVPIRYGRMLVSPFTFFRGAAYVMAADLAGMPRTGLHVQLCGDAHLSNFGGYAAPDRRLVFDSNDFDETLPGPFEWDLKRLVASFAVAGRSRGFDADTRARINLAVTRSYREAVAAFAAMRIFDVWYSRDRRRGTGARVGVAGEQEGGQAVRGQCREGALERQPQSVREADTGRRRRAALRQRPAADRARSANSTGRGEVRRRALRDPLLPSDAPERPLSTPRAVPLRRRGAQGRRSRQRRNEGVGRAVRRPGQRRPADPSGQGGAGLGARAVPRQEQVPAVTASGWSRGSG